MPGILDLAGRHAGPLVRGDVAGVVARGLHGVNADLGEIGQRIRQFGELDPVELDVLPGGEMAVAAVVSAARHAPARRNCFDDSVP